MASGSCLPDNELRPGYYVAHYRKQLVSNLPGTGSIDFVAAARSVLSFGKDAVTGERLFVHSKANLSSCGPAQAFALNESTTPPFSWLGSRDGINPDAIMATH